VLIAAEEGALALLRGDGDRDGFGLEPAVLPRGDGALVGAERVLVLLFAGDAVLAAQVLGRLQHAALDGISIGAGGDAATVEAVHQVDAATVGSPADGGGVELGVAHALDAAGEHDIGDAGLHFHRRQADRLQAGAAAAVKLESGHLDGQASMQHGQAAHRGGFAVGVAVAEDRVADHGRIDTGALEQRLDDGGCQRLGIDILEGAAEPTDRGSERATDNRITHRKSPFDRRISRRVCQRQD
jgi:hypothetical protein